MTLETITLRLPAIHCSGCANTVGKVLERAGAHVEATDLDSKSVRVAFDPGDVTLEQLKSALEAIGFPPSEGDEG